jgi:3-hydroxy-9,10-secoandrosta-1,3,5(10)-triene-9,17-dione monooxygenase
MTITTIPIPEPDLTADTMMERAKALRPVLRERQPATEAAGRLLDETHEAFVEAGFYRALQPRRFGGYEFDLRDYIRIMMEVARGCPSSAWVLALTAGHPHLLGRFGEQAQRDVYGLTGDSRVPGRPVPGGEARPVHGGYMLSGAWDYASGCDHATHYVAAGGVPGTDPPRLLFLIIERDDFGIVDNWNTIGLRGTGSKRVVAENVFVPGHRTMVAPGTEPGPPPGFGTHDNPLFSGGVFPLFFFEIGAVAIGTARGAIDVYEEILQTRRTDIPPFTTRGELRQFQHHLGEAIALVDLAESALLGATDRYLAQGRRALETQTPIDENCEECRRIVLLEQQVVRLAGEAASLLFRTGGTAAARNGSVLSNAMLALSVMQTHMGLQWDRTMENVARQRLGLEPGFV